MLSKKLASVLPSRTKFSVHHFQTKPRQCRRPLVYYGDEYEDVFDNDTDININAEKKRHSYVTHFIVLASNADNEDNENEVSKNVTSSDETKTKNEPLPTSRKIILYGIEVYIFFSPEYTTIFVSKADTTGQKLSNGARISYMAVTRSIIEYLLSSHTTNPNEKEINKPGIPVRICLFTRPEKQYLFPLSAPPESIDGSKHLMSGTQLVKWWIECFEPIVKEMESVRARLEMPGSDKRTVEGIINGKENWSTGVIFDEEKETKIVEKDCGSSKMTSTENNGASNDSMVSKNTAAIYHIPRFPDDPKARFLDYIMYEERRDLKTSMAQFWIELQGRQEFLLGMVTGIIGIEGHYRTELKSEQFTTQTKLDLKADYPVLSYKDFKNLREIVTTSDYSTRELVIDAYNELLCAEPDFTKTDFTGDMETENTLSGEKMTPSGDRNPVINNLTNLVRRKRVINDNVAGKGNDDPGSINILESNLIRKKRKN